LLSLSLSLSLSLTLVSISLTFLFSIWPFLSFSAPRVAKESTSAQSGFKR
jgi:hypothetical protein